MLTKRPRQWSVYHLQICARTLSNTVLSSIMGASCNTSGRSDAYPYIGTHAYWDYNTLGSSTIWVYACWGYNLISEVTISFVSL